MCKLDFTILADSNNGVLSPNDLRFFYYDIGLDNLSGIPVVYEENEETYNFKIGKHLTIDAVEKNLLTPELKERLDNLYDLRNNIHILKAAEANYNPKLREAKESFKLMRDVVNYIRHYYENAS